MKLTQSLLLLCLFLPVYAQEIDKSFPYFGLSQVDLNESINYYNKNPDLEKKKMSYKNLLFLLKENNYKKINGYFDLIQKAKSENKLSINHYSDLFLLPVSDPKLEDIGLFSSWQENEPDSYSSNLITGTVFRNLGNQARGTKFASKTSENQFKTMAQLFNKSKEYLDKAIQINPTNELAYIQRMGISRGLDEITSVFQNAQKHIPHSYLIYNYYIARLKPRWYGSYEQMRTLALQAQTSTQFEPRIRVLLGQEAADMAFRYKSSKDYEKAIKYYNYALYHGAFAVWIENRRDSYFALNEYKKALPDTQLLDKIQHISARSLRKSVIVKQKNNLPFQSDIELIKELDQNGGIAFSLGSFFTVNKIHTDIATDLYAFAILKDPNTEVYYQWYIGALIKSKNPDLPRALANHIKLCDKIECKYKSYLMRSKNMKSCIENDPKCTLSLSSYEFWKSKE